MINDNNHSSKYIFFDFIKTELDLENPDHKLSYEILTTIENMYRNSLLQESAIKKLMNKSKELHTKINLIVQPCSTLDTAAVWDPSCNQIKIELPNSQLQSRNLEKTIYTFVDNLMWELCNSVNKYFTYQNCLSLSVIGMQSPDLSAFLNELAEYQTALEHFQIIWHIAADSKKVINSSIGFEQKILKIFSLYSSTLEIDSFRQYWLYVSYNNNSSAYNYLTHSGFYRKDSVVLNEKLSNSTLSELTFEEDDKHEKQLNKIYDEIITELKHGTFDITIVKKKYSSTLIDAASYDEDNKNNYYLLYQIIFKEGNRHAIIKEFSFIFEIESIIIDVAQNKLSLNKVSEDEKTLIYLAFDIAIECNNLSLSNINKIETIINKHRPLLEEIRIRNSTLAAKYQSSLYTILDTKHFPLTYKYIIQQYLQQEWFGFSSEFIDLLHNALNIKSLWRHQKELVLFSYKNNDDYEIEEDDFILEKPKVCPLMIKNYVQ